MKLTFPLLKKSNLNRQISLLFKRILKMLFIFEVCFLYLILPKKRHQYWILKLLQEKKGERITAVWQKWRFSATADTFVVNQVWFSASTFVVKIATFAKSWKTLAIHPKTTVLKINIRTKNQLSNRLLRRKNIVNLKRITELN